MIDVKSNLKPSTFPYRKRIDIYTEKILPPNAPAALEIKNSFPVVCLHLDPMTPVIPLGIKKPRGGGNQFNFAIGKEEIDGRCLHLQARGSFYTSKGHADLRNKNKSQTGEKNKRSANPNLELLYSILFPTMLCASCVCLAKIMI